MNATYDLKGCFLDCLKGKTDEIDCVMSLEMFEQRCKALELGWTDVEVLDIFDKLCGKSGIDNGLGWTRFKKMFNQNENPKIQQFYFKSLV